MTWLNWSLKFYSRLRTIPHLIHTHTTHMPMFNECLIHLFDCTCLNVMCVCSSLYGSNQKDFWSFYIYLEVIFITLCVHVICLLCFSLFKHVLCWKNKCRNFWLLVLATCKPQDPSREFIQKLWRLTRYSWKFSWLNLATCPVAKRPKIAF